MRFDKVCLLALVSIWMAGCSLIRASSSSISGYVLNETGPIAGAMVRVKAAAIEATTAQDGSFLINGLPVGKAVYLTAWAPGYYIGGGESIFRPGATGVEIYLTRHAQNDNCDYTWVSAFSQPGSEQNQCQNCHSSALSTDPGSTLPGSSTRELLPFDQWVEDAHALSAVNPRFLSMYLGTDVRGNPSPLTEYINNRDYGRIPLRPDPTQPYFGPGYKLDFPESTGNCAACHAPAAAINNPYHTDPSLVSGVGAEGVTCDFCHKIWDVRLDTGTGLPMSNMPGVLSYEFLRPPAGHQFFAGPLVDVAPGEDTYTPIQTQSQYCASCHYGVFWGTQVYNSFGEWLDSPYSDPETGMTCQGCHMPSTGADHFALLDKGGFERQPDSIVSHRMLGASDAELLQNSVTMDIETERNSGLITITVTITNDQTGHAVPTDSPLRQMILILNVTDQAKESLPMIGGSRLPAWCGIGDPALGYYGGLPGKVYARILQERWTEVYPSGAYWNPTRILSDNRLVPFASDTTQYVFKDADPGQKVKVEVSLIFRRAFIDLMDQKGWDIPDIPMEEMLLVLE
jgi:hypothetical protein